MTTKHWLIGGGIAAAAALAIYFIPSAKAADLGGNCCADLEERVAELEATTARKGNRKVRLTISGEVSKALLWHDLDGLPGADKLRVIDNPNSGSKIRFSGDAKIGTNASAGFVLELGYDETRGNLLAISADDMTVRHSFAYISGAMGKISIGRTSSATDGIVEMDLSGTNIASLPMSTEPLWTYSGLGGTLGGLLNPTGYDGSRANVVRYDTPTVGGFMASASWGGGQTASGDDVWDAALRWAGEFSGVRLAAGAGYRVENLDAFAAGDMKTLGASASMLHVVSGLFLNGSFAQQDAHPLWGDSQMWHVRGGMAKNIFGLGNTAPYLEYAQHDLKDFGVDSTFWGVGVVQTIDAAAMDVFFAYRTYDIGGAFDVSTGMAGARIKF